MITIAVRGARIVAGALLCLSTADAAKPTLTLAPPGTVAADGLVLKAGTAVPLIVADAITSKTHGQGDRVDLTVADDIAVGGHIVIPRGAAALAEIARHTAKGSYGKAGKLELRLLHVAVGNRRIRLNGSNQHAGSSGTVPALATGIVAGVFGAFITGKTATLPAGTRVIGYVHRDLPLIAAR